VPLAARNEMTRPWSTGTALANLALEGAELVAERKLLGAELGVGAGASQHEVDDEDDELVGEAKKKHGGGICLAPRRSADASRRSQLRGLLQAGLEQPN
jgi:hypothetical protein